MGPAAAEPMGVWEVTQGVQEDTGMAQGVWDDTGGQEELRDDMGKTQGVQEITEGLEGHRGSGGTQG